MNVCKRILGLVGLLLGAVGLLLSVAIGVGVWVVKEPATARATHLFERIDAGLDLMDQKLEHARTALVNAAERLESIKKERSLLPKESRRGDFARMALARTVQRTLAPELNDAHQNLHEVAEAAVVVNSVLEDVGTLPFLAETGLNMDRLADSNSRIARVGPAAWELSRLLGEADPEAEAQRSQVEQFLTRLRESVIDYHNQVEEVRQRTTALHDKVFEWITAAVIIVSSVSFWIALSQLCVLSRAWSWITQPGRNP
jgi:predicted  nucleic acid-binding Zn-ribbon protein